MSDIISQKSTNTPSKSTNTTSQVPCQLEMFQELAAPTSEKLTSLLSDFHAKIFQLLETAKDWKVVEVAYSFKRQGLFVNCNPQYLSLKTSKDCFRQTKERHLSDACERLPTLGYMSASGNCLILPGFSPQIESGYTLSDILQKPEEVSEKYFLSENSIKSLLEYNERNEKKGNGFRAEFPTENEIKSTLKIGGGIKTI